MKVVFVYTGNVCRSPMGELLLPHYMPDLEADSAGTRGLDAHEIAPNSAKLLAAHGIDTKQFRSKRITPQLANSSGLILCFEHEQRKEIAVIAPTAARRTFLINDFANMCAYCKEQGYMDGDTREERLESVIDNASMIRPMIPDTANIEDPMGKDYAVYERSYQEICKALQTIADTTTR